MQPGQTITPGSRPPDTAGPSQPAPQPAASPPPDVPEPEPKAAEPETNWQFSSNDYASDPHPEFSGESVNWTASEFVSHEKNASWYLLVVLSSVIVAAVVYLITQDAVSAVVLIIVGAAFAAFGARKPRVLEYIIDERGIQIGNRQYPYEAFRTFSVTEEDSIRSILLMPMQRFNLPITVYYDPADEDKIINALAPYLPHQDRKPAAVDNFMRRIRF